MPTPQQRNLIVLGGDAPLPVPVPQLGAELLTNGGFDADANWTKGGGWSISGGLAVGATAQTGLSQTLRMADNLWYYTQWDIVTVTSSGVSPFNGSTIINPIDSTTGTKYRTFVAAGTTFGINGRGTGFSGTIDNVSLKAITLASMFSALPYGTHMATKAQATVVAGTRAGVVANLDSATSPANFVIASVDGTSARLTKAVAGTYTELLTVAVTYVPGAFVEIRRLAASNTYRLFYNNVQCGADQTIADAQIVSNTLAGMFNTWFGNTLAAFSCVPS